MADSTKRVQAWVWCARVAWALLPVTTGAAFTDALTSWSSASARVAAALLWVGWAGGLVALFAPRPWGLTLLRVAAPTAVVCALLAVTSASVAGAIAAVAGSLVAAALALSWPVSYANANALAYGDEIRAPLRVPTPLLAGPLPIAVLAVAFGVATGPLLLAAGHVAAGVVMIVLGFPIAFLVARSLNVLARRWLVFVPAGIALVDPLTLADPSLIRREQIVALRRVSTVAVPEHALDLRLGTLAGGIALELGEPALLARRRGRADAELLEPTLIVVAVPRVGTVVGCARAHRIATR